MRDRISIQFKNGDDVSVALFSHWDGKSMLMRVEDYIAELESYLGRNNRLPSYPLGRLDPSTVMVDFVRWLMKIEYNEGERVNGNYYFGKDDNDGDNSDNGAWVYDLKELCWVGSRKRSTESMKDMFKKSG